MLPTVSFDDPSGTYTFTLWRDGKKVIHKTMGFFVGLYAEAETNISHSERAKIDGPAVDGYLYYICTEGFDGEETFIWVTKNEFELLEDMVDQIREGLYEAEEYEFTRTTLRDMHEHPEKYGPEQRARDMIWDESDAPEAYREHPLDHE